MDYILADNQELTRQGLASIIGEHPDSNIHIATDKASLLSLLSAHPACIVLIDFTLFDFDDEESLLIVSERYPDVVWILVSDELTSSFMRKVIYSCQTVGIVFKGSTVRTVREAVAAALNGKRYVCQNAMEIILEQNTLAEDKSTLTHTELLILKAIAQGKTTKEIAAERFCSIHTINAHRKNIFRKLSVNTAHEAVKHAFRAGLVDPSEFYI